MQIALSEPKFTFFNIVTTPKAHISIHTEVKISTRVQYVLLHTLPKIRIPKNDPWLFLSHILIILL